MPIPRGLAGRDPVGRPGTRTRVVVAAAIGWAGLVAHNGADLPALEPTALEYVGPTIVTVALVGLWLAAPGRWPRILLLGWALLNLAGAIVTILPLAVLPFAPEQSWRHYAFHLVYGAAQLPLILILARRDGTGEASGVVGRGKPQHTRTVPRRNP